MKIRASIVGICIFIIGCTSKTAVDKETTLPFFNSGAFTPEWIPETSDKYVEIHTIPEFKFTNQEGNLVTNKTYEGKIYVADFFFTSCPGICPILTKNMRRLQDIFKNDPVVALLSHSVTPSKDSVSVLKAYALENDVDASIWNLVTGPKKEIYAMARNSYFADEDFIKTQNEETFIHTENFVLIDKKGRIRGVYNGTLAIETDRIVRHINLLKKEG